jgi:poly(A) polymerase
VHTRDGRDRHPTEHRASDRLIHRDNTYGTPEEDAFRRDFTVNALFYDIGTLSIIDYVGGRHDLEGRLIRCIGDPDTRFLEDPVRMLRAVVLASRLQFTIDEPILDAIAAHRHEIARSAPARLLEEYYKILRSGHAEEAMRQLRATKLLKEITPELTDAPDALWQSIGALDRYRARFNQAPDALTNAILAGALLLPLGMIGRRPAYAADPLGRRVELGLLPVARRDVDRLDQILAMEPRLLDVQAPRRTQRALLHRSAFEEALTWMQIYGDRPDIVAHWRDVQAEGFHHHERAQEHHSEMPFWRRRRRRRRPSRTSARRR